MVVQPDLVEIISWNDFGESHYIGPLPQFDYKAFEVGKPPYDYITGMPHDAWRKLLPFWIDPYKTGKASISEELVVGWYRPNPAKACKMAGRLEIRPSNFSLSLTLRKLRAQRAASVWQPVHCQPGAKRSSWRVEEV
jgi:hypothetical protein